MVHCEFVNRCFSIANAKLKSQISFSGPMLLKPSCCLSFCVWSHHPGRGGCGAICAFLSCSPFSVWLHSVPSSPHGCQDVLSSPQPPWKLLITVKAKWMVARPFSSWWVHCLCLVHLQWNDEIIDSMPQLFFCKSEQGFISHGSHWVDILWTKHNEVLGKRAHACLSQLLWKFPNSVPQDFYCLIPNLCQFSNHHQSQDHTPRSTIELPPTWSDHTPRNTNELFPVWSDHIPRSTNEPFPVWSDHTPRNTNELPPIWSGFFSGLFIYIISIETLPYLLCSQRLVFWRNLFSLLFFAWKHFKIL